MSDKKIELPPITLPQGKRTEGTLLSVPVRRLTKKSAFLKSLEPKKPRKQKDAVVTQFRTRK